MPKYYVAGIAYYDNALQHQGIQQTEDDKKYGVPELKKFPMPDAAHVRSAIRFFQLHYSKIRKTTCRGHPSTNEGVRIDF